MIFYICIWGILLLLSFYKHNKYIFWGSILVLSFIAGGRSELIGVDTHNYKDIYGWIADGISYPIEPGWYFLNKLINELGGNFNLLLWIVSLMTLIPIGIVCVKCSENPQLSLFFYYSLYAYLNSFNVMRQFLAISFVLLAYSYVFQRGKFFVCILLAFIFHYSAVVSVVVILLNNILLTKKRIINGLVATFLLGLFFNNTIFSFLTGSYAGYLETDIGYRDNFQLVVIMCIMMNGLYLFFYFTIMEEYRQNFWTKVFFVAIMVMNLSMQLELGTRILLYFTLSQIIFYPIYFKHNIVRNKMCIIFCVLFYVASVFMKILILGSQNEYSVFPYKNVWFNFM